MRIAVALRTLWRYRVLLLVAALVSAVAGVSLGYRLSLPAGAESRGYDVGTASVNVLVDTSPSLAADLRNSGAVVATLSDRAKLLGHLVARSPLRERIAGRAGVAADRLLTIAPPPSRQLPPETLPTVSGASVGEDDRRASLLRTDVPIVAGDEAPVIAIETQSSTSASALRLADAAVGELQALLASVARDDGVAPLRQTVARPLAPPVVGSERRGPHAFTPFVVGFGMFAAACGLVLAWVALAGAWQRAALEEPVV
jgi:hypothetical protein